MKRIRSLIIGIVCISLVVGFYYYVSNRSTSSSKNEVELTEVQKLVLKDLEEKSYPETPRSVIKLYTRIQKCFYNEEYTEEELEKLADQARCLMDQELIDNNPKDVYDVALGSDIEGYKDNSRTISNVKITDSNDVIYKKVDGAECAYVTVSYFLREKKVFNKTMQKYVLRKDADERWKILAFELIEGETDE